MFLSWLQKINSLRNPHAVGTEDFASLGTTSLRHPHAADVSRTAQTGGGPPRVPGVPQVPEVHLLWDSMGISLVTLLDGFFLFTYGG